MNEARKTVLLVEDQGSVAAAEKKSLELYGYKVILARSGESAIEVLAGTEPIDIILMDIDLGEGMDGTQAAQRILKDHDIPLVFVSSHTDPEVVEKTEKITSYGYVVKKSGITVLDASIKMAFKLFEANRIVKATRDKLEATLDALPDVLFEVGLDGRIFDFHSPHADLLYQSSVEVVGKGISDFHPADNSATFMSAVREAHEKGYSSGKQFEMAVPAGLRWFEISVSRKAGAEHEPHFIILKRDITGRKQAETALQKAFEENRNLLGELQHRVKNSFSMISSMIGLAAGAASSPDTEAALSELDVRVMSVSELYSLLYASGSFTEVRLEDYCDRVAATIVGLSENISIETDMESMVVSVKRAAPIGLIVTELVTNAVKYAFPGGRPGIISVSLKKNSRGAILVVRDDGVGLPAGFDLAASRGMGLNLVRSLLSQIDGKFRLEADVKGTSCSVDFALAEGGGK